jgi:hypothetical protein
MKTSGAYAADPSLSTGVGFYLQPDGNWGIEEIPEKVIRESEFSGYLTIQGYKSAVFEMPDGSQWAQKLTEPEEEISEDETDTKVASLCRIATRIIR